MSSGGQNQEDPSILSALNGQDAAGRNTDSFTSCHNKVQTLRLDPGWTKGSAGLGPQQEVPISCSLLMLPVKAQEVCTSEL